MDLISAFNSLDPNLLKARRMDEIERLDGEVAEVLNELTDEELNVLLRVTIYLSRQIHKVKTKRQDIEKAAYREAKRQKGG